MTKDEKVRLEMSRHELIDLGVLLDAICVNKSSYDLFSLRDRVWEKIRDTR